MLDSTTLLIYYSTTQLLCYSATLLLHYSTLLLLYYFTPPPPPAVQARREPGKTDTGLAGPPYMPLETVSETSWEKPGEA